MFTSQKLMGAASDLVVNVLHEASSTTNSNLYTFSSVSYGSGSADNTLVLVAMTANDVNGNGYFDAGLTKINGILPDDSHVSANTSGLNKYLGCYIGIFDSTITSGNIVIDMSSSTINMKIVLLEIIGISPTTIIEKKGLTLNAATTANATVDDALLENNSVLIQACVSIGDETFDNNPTMETVIVNELIESNRFTLGISNGKTTDIDLTTSTSSTSNGTFGFITL